MNRKNKKIIVLNKKKKISTPIKIVCIILIFVVLNIFYYLCNLFLSGYNKAYIKNKKKLSLDKKIEILKKENSSLKDEKKELLEDKRAQEILLREKGYIKKDEIFIKDITEKTQKSKNPTRSN